MSSNIHVQNGTTPDKYIRPAWKYIRPDDKGSGGTIELSQLEMLESVRNVLEDIQRSQMLQCDVAYAIKDMAKTLRRIDRRLAKVEKLRDADK
jgi:hypothetical protein